MASYETLIPIGFLLLAHLILHGKIRGVFRLIIILATTGLSLALSFHLIPGYSNWLIVSDTSLGPNALPYTLYYNFDKPFIGFFILALNLPLIDKSVDWRKMLFKTIPLSLIGICVILFLAMKFHIVNYDFKIASFLPVWILANLFLTSMPEEAFFRGFLQRELTESINAFWSPIISILLISFGFALVHIKFIHNPFYILLVFVSSLVYGTIYQITKRIESSIFCHFFLNLVHILFFTYPALSGVIKAKS